METIKILILMLYTNIVKILHYVILLLLFFTWMIPVNILCSKSIKIATNKAFNHVLEGGSDE